MILFYRLGNRQKDLPAIDSHPHNLYASHWKSWSVFYVMVEALDFSWYNSLYSNYINVHGNSVQSHKHNDTR